MGKAFSGDIIFIQGKRMKDVHEFPKDIENCVYGAGPVNLAFCLLLGDCTFYIA